MIKVPVRPPKGGDETFLDGQLYGALHSDIGCMVKIRVKDLKTKVVVKDKDEDEPTPESI